MIGVVTTTITNPHNYPSLFEHYKGKEDIVFYIVGDNKTPDKMESLDLGLEKGYPFVNFPMKDQKEWIFSLVKGNEDQANRFWRVFQENNYQRRIIGFLRAVLEGATTIIAVDDDNYPREGEDLISEHLSILRKKKVREVKSDYINYPDFLDYQEKGTKKLYVRGFPLHYRGDQMFIPNDVSANIGCNVGLWEGSPDIDSLSRMAYGDVQVKPKDNMMTLALAKGTYASMCLQNIAFKSKYLLLQYEFPMGYPIATLPFGRYDDIWAGYVCKKIFDKLDVQMSFGPPIALHKRNVHNELKDFLNEFWGLYLNTFFFTAIQNIVIEEKKDMLVMYGELLNKLSKSLRFSDPEINRYFGRVFLDMISWAYLVEAISG